MIKNNIPVILNEIYVSSSIVENCRSTDNICRITGSKQERYKTKNIAQIKNSEIFT